MFKKYKYDMFSLDFTHRRQLDDCYIKWNIKPQEYEYK